MRYYTGQEIFNMKETMIKFVMLVTCVTNIKANPIIQTFLKEPETVSVKEGDNVTLPCTIKNKVGVLQWTKDDFGLGTSRDLDGYDRYSMMGGDDSTWNLRIFNVSLEDEAMYQCQVGATIDARPIRSKYAKLTVISPPMTPDLSIASEMPIEEGQLLNAECISRGGKPAPNIRWLRNNKYIDSGVKVTERDSEGSRTNTMSTLQFTASWNDTSITCEVTHDAINEKQEVTKQLIVKHSPIMNINSNKKPLHDGDTVVFTCNIDAVPAATYIVWTINDEEVQDTRGSTKLVLNVNKF